MIRARGEGEAGGGEGGTANPLTGFVYRVPARTSLKLLQEVWGEDGKKKTSVYSTTDAPIPQIAKLRTNKPLTPADLEELERLLLAADVGESKDKLATLYSELGSLPAFIRSLVGLDRAAVNDAFAAFLGDAGRALSSAQANFLRQIVDYLTRQGVMEIGALYEAPFTHVHAEGPEGLFPEPDIAALVHIIKGINANANFPANDAGAETSPTEQR